MFHHLVLLMNGILSVGVTELPIKVPATLQQRVFPLTTPDRVDAPTILNALQFQVHTAKKQRVIAPALVPVCNLSGGVQLKNGIRSAGVTATPIKVSALQYLHTFPLPTQDHADA
jgi:hypothetical protein